MGIVQFFVQKLKSLDPMTLENLKRLAQEYDRAYPGTQTPQDFDLAVSAFCRQRMPGAAPQTHQLLRFYLVFHRFGSTSPSGLTEQRVLANMGPAVRKIYNQLSKDDPGQARAFLIQEMMASMKLMNEILSNVSKTRSEISQTFARNARA
jgi:hypothetical protein